jgi:hypothetical protein
MRDEIANVEQIGCEVFLDREEGEELAAHAKRLLEQLDFMIDRPQKPRDCSRRHYR